MAANNRKQSDTPTIINNSTHESFQRNENKIKNVKYRKSQRTFNISHFIIIKRKLKKRNNTYPYIRYKNKTINVRKRRHRFSKLKKNILETRRNKQIALKNHEDIDRVTEDLFNLALNVNHENKLHSRRFRGYCDNLSSKELCLLVEKVLRELFHYQKRTYQNNQYKGRNRRRVVIGFREVQAQLKLDKLKLVVIATDCEKCDIEGGLDSIITTIKNECENRGVPCAFSLLRRQISYALFIRSPVSCVGIKDYDGAQDTFHSLLKTLERDKYNYKKKFE